MENTKGVCLVRMENGENVYHYKINYLRMKRAGRNVCLLAEAPTMEELNEKIGK